MEIKDILALANAGFSKDDIAKIASIYTPTPVPAQTPVPALAPTPVPALTPTPAPAQAQAPVQATVFTSGIQPSPATAPVDDSVNRMLAEMTLLRQDIQNNNIMNSQQPHVDTAEDIIAKIINPPNFKKE